jgi:hypothetical protein
MVGVGEGVGVADGSTVGVTDGVMVLVGVTVGFMSCWATPHAVLVALSNTSKTEQHSLINCADAGWKAWPVIRSKDLVTIVAPLGKFAYVVHLRRSLAC